MKILALDIGAGTEDVLLYDDRKERVENSIKLVLPSPSRVYATQVQAATQRCQDLFITGDIIGGGALTSSLKKHLKAGFRVTMTEPAAYTVRNVLDEVRDLGISITSKDMSADFLGTMLFLEEVNLTKLRDFLVHFNEPLSDVDVVAVAVQDHGVFPQGTSNRRFRIQKMKERLERDPRPEALMFKEDEVPSCFLRMKSVVQASKRQLPMAKVVVMDTAPAAILGCLEDPTIKGATTVLAINVGNGHTMAALIEGNKLLGMLEHHTQALNPQKIEQLLLAFADGRLTDDEVFRDNGHGVFFLREPIEFSKIDKIVVTGPNRRLLNQTTLPVRFAAPAGDVMMTGPMGLVEATRRIITPL